MTTFDLAEVRRFAADLDARMDRCDNGEGLECANLDKTLHWYATSCWEFCEHVREWGRAIFSGQAAFDPAVEQVWLDEGIQLSRRANELWAYGQEKTQGVCYVLEGGAVLGAALWRLERLLANWVTPKLAIAPIVRLGFASTAKDEVQRRVDALPPLAADWQPADPRQRARLRQLRQQPTS